MSDRNVYIEDEEVVRTLQTSLELELSELRSLHEAHADDLQEAFSPGIINLLRKLSEDDSFFQYPTPEESSPSESCHSTEGTYDYWKATRMTFKFLCDEFMPAPKEQQMGRFQSFLDQVRGTASRIRLPGGASLSPDQNSTLKQCVTAVKTMKEVLGSKFTSLQKYVRMQMEQGSRGPFAGGLNSADARGFASNVPQTESASSTRHETAPGYLQRFASNVPQTESASSARHETAPGYLQGFASDVNPMEPDSSNRPETIFRYSGASNPEVSRVIRENPTHINVRGPGDTPVLTRTGVIVSNVIRLIQETPARSILQPSPDHSVLQETPAHSVLEQTTEEVNQGGSRQSPRKRNPLKRQSHVVEED